MPTPRNNEISQMMSSALESITSSCLHCGALATGEDGFCCAGCETVYRLLHARGLSEFYEWKRRAPAVRPAQPVAFSAENYAGWDTIAFTERHLRGGIVRFFLDGVHCIGCLWLIESLPRLFAAGPIRSPRSRPLDRDLSNHAGVPSE